MYKICIDPGHSGSPDPGACNQDTGLRESDVALAVSKLIAKYLQVAGCETMLTRTDQEQPETDDLSYRTDLANNWGADLFISIHCNAATSSAKGTETWYCDDSTAGKRLAACIQEQVVNSLNTTDRGIKKATPHVNGLYVLSYTDMPSCLVELAFISNPDDEQLLANADTQDEFSKSIARGITDYIRGPF